MLKEAEVLTHTIEVAGAGAKDCMNLLNILNILYKEISECRDRDRKSVV